MITHSRLEQTWTRFRNEYLIYIVMLLMVESVYVGLLSVWPALRAPARLAPFTALMLLHSGLHLLAPRFAARYAALSVYFVIQCMLVLAITLSTRESASLFTLYLYLALAAQSVSVLGGKLRPSILAVAALLGMGLATYIALWGWADLLPFLFLAFPQEFFILALFTLLVQQSNERKRMQALLRELETAHRQLEQYAVQTVDLTRAAERQRMARELHDTLAQGLAGLILQLEAIDARLSRGGSAQAQMIVHQAMSRARATLADARHAIDNLRAGESNGTMVNSGNALCTAIQDEVARFTTASGVPCAVDCDLPGTLPAALYEHALRALSESLSNIARHAHAQQAWVRLTHEGGQLHVTVRDDGIGFDAAAVHGRNGHYGLTGLLERARLAGGEFLVTSASGSGTTITLHLPLSEVQPVHGETEHA